MKFSLAQLKQHRYPVEFFAKLHDWRDNPDLLRRTLRDSMPGQILVCGLASPIIGALVVLLHHAILLAHTVTFGTDENQHLSSATNISSVRLLLVPALGGLLLGLITLTTNHLKAREIVDPIEANAVHGGRLSLFGSARLIGASFLSNMFGSSVGMEAAYTQMGSGIFSTIGKLLHLRRDDMRIFVAAGAAAAIGAAFNAPLAGAFYGFELILGAYTISAISQVAAAALFGTLAAQLLTKGEPIFALPLESVSLPDWYYLLFLLQGIGAALVGTITMMAVTRCEHITHRLKIPTWLRPAIGGLLLGMIAMAYPQVLGSGQGAINEHLHESWPMLAVAILLLAKIAGSALSIGSGFRGGLFSSSLLIGCLFGQLFGLTVGHFLPQGQENLEIFMLVGMGGVAASIVGAPVTIVLLILEMTGSFPAATSVLMGVLVASAITRHYFGYSFSTWRFHLRGLRISGAHDIGWIQELTVASLMRTDVHTVSDSVTYETLLPLIEARSSKRVYVADAQGTFLGRIDKKELHAASEKNLLTAGALAKLPDQFLLPHQNIKQALQLFAQWETEQLPVVESEHSALVIGYVSESYGLRRYTQELEAHNLAQFGTASPKTT